jgi:hypothetical protein
MTDLNPGYGSPYVQATRATSPKEVMFRLHREHPRADKDELLRLFRLEAGGDPELTDICVEVAGINAYLALENIRNRAKRRPAETPEQQRQEQDAEAAQQAAVIADRIVRSAILDFMMPNNKRLRDCTFSEVRKFGKGFSRIAAAGRPNQIVGQVLSETKAKSLMRPQ